jgi:hypothetical protein
MGDYVGCGVCGAQVYTTSDRLPFHHSPEGAWCPNKHKASDPIEYETGRDDDWWVYGGGLWEKDRSKF